MRHAEHEYISGVLRLLYKYRNDDPLDMAFIKENIENYLDFELNSSDLKPFYSRSTSEPSYKQIVGNLISHKHPNLFRYINATPNLFNTKLFYQINLEGIQYVEMFVGEKPKHIIPAGEPKKYQQFSIFDEQPSDDKKGKGDVSAGTRKLPLEPGCLSESINRKFFEETCIVCGGTTNTNYYNIIPLSAVDDFFPVNIDVNENKMCLCEKCAHNFNSGDDEFRENMFHIITHGKKRKELAAANIFIGSEKSLIK